MKIRKIKQVGKLPVYDISVKDAEHYVLENGVITHNTGPYYSASSIFIVGRQQEKDGTELVGYNFVINVEKSRFTREKSKIFIQVINESGINKWSGLMDMALTSGHVIKPKNGWYAKVNMETGEIDPKNWRLADTNSAAFWTPVVASESFKKYVKDTYQLAGGEMIADSEIDAELEAV